MESGATEGVVLLEGGFSMALRPENLPARHTFGSGGSHKSFDVATHLFDVQREGHYVPAIASFGRIYRTILQLRQRLHRVDEDFGVPSARGYVPGIHSLQFCEADRRLHFSHAIVPANHVMDVWEFLLQFEKIEPLFHVVAVIAKAAREPGK